jgi:hypothetical protein
MCISETRCPVHPKRVLFKYFKNHEQIGLRTNLKISTRNLKQCSPDARVKDLPIQTSDLLDHPPTPDPRAASTQQQLRSISRIAITLNAQT